MDRHRQTPWHALKLTEVYETLHTSEEGLGDAEAAERLKKHGRNELRSKPPKTILQMLKAQIVDPMVLILIGAAVFSAILQEWTEAAVIFVIVIVNAVIGIVQEKKAQSSLEALRNMSAPTARVLRQGEESVIPASNLVVGDVVMLGDGDMVPADLRLIDSANLKVQEASLTGESVPSEKEAEDILPEDCPLGDRSNMAYTSAIVTYGRATGVVVATGMDTEVGNIAGMHDDLDSIVRDIREAHRKDKTTADPQPTLDDVKEKFEQAIGQGSDTEMLIHEFCDKLQIPFEKISSEDFSAFLRILSLSKQLKNSNNMRGKASPIPPNRKARRKRK